ncbi:hypothetical protein D9V28_15340 [Mycetocola zhadangensis]|uniref:Uncharacterized protein n=1 Tax=Mycetocola zhadangensis TaxID=1164595 RepID=A0A3L7IVV3_9MICO|nr:hypothetical protein D9V28_15340 [Mycetocola zhadangensis]
MLIISLVFLGPALHLMRKSTEAARTGPFAARVSSLIAVAGITLFWLSRWLPREHPGATWIYAIPLVAGSLAVVALAILSVQAPKALGVREVDVAPRTLWSFGSRWWFAGWYTLTALLLATAVVCGLTSSTDELGRHTMLVLDVGSHQAGTSFFGWAFGVPVLVASVLLLVIGHLAISQTVRPAVSADPKQRALDIASRCAEIRTIVAVAAGATAFVLGAVLLFVAGSAGMVASFPAADGVRVELGTSFAALRTPFLAAGLILQGFGLCLALLPLFQRKGALISSIPGQVPVAAGTADR